MISFRFYNPELSWFSSTWTSRTRDHKNSFDPSFLTDFCDFTIFDHFIWNSTTQCPHQFNSRLSVLPIHSFTHSPNTCPLRAFYVPMAALYSEATEINKTGQIFLLKRLGHIQCLGCDSHLYVTYCYVLSQFSGILYLEFHPHIRHHGHVLPAPHSQCGLN